VYGRKSTSFINFHRLNVYINSVVKSCLGLVSCIV